MIKYTLEANGSYTDNELGWQRIVPGSPLWSDVQAWLAAGNVPLSPQPSSLHTLVGNTWVLDLTAAQKSMKRKIRAERLVRLSGGIYVGNLWLPSDPGSRTEYFGLLEAARVQIAAGGSLGDPLLVDGDQVEIEALSGEYYVLTCRKAQTLIDDLSKLDRRLRRRMRSHIDAMMLTANPLAYDYSGNWPARYEETV
jgi:hypothetical protein